MLPTQSHCNSIFRIIQCLNINPSPNITLCVNSFLKNYILSQPINLDIYILDNTAPFGCGLEESWIRFEQGENIKQIYLDIVISRLSFSIYQERKKKLEALMEKVKPNVIFLDSFLSTDFIILYPLLKAKGIKLVLLQTMLSTLYNEGIPPLNSHLIPENQKLVEKTWKSFLWNRKAQRFKDKIKYLGYDDLSMIKKKFKENKIPKRYSIIPKVSFGVSFANIPEWILAPAELEFFPEKKAPWQIYIGSMIDLNRKEFADESYLDFEEKIQIFKGGRKKLIYCSFGTLTHLNVEGTARFFRNIIYVAKNNPNYLLIFSGTEEIQKQIQELPENVYWFRFVPQLRLLAQVDLFITHGGLNSIKESLHFCVPMLIYPMYNRTDNYGNAARIFYHRLGLRGEISQDSPQQITEKIQELLTNPIYKQNLQAFKEKTKAKYTEERVSALFEELIREPALI